jgi:tRNA pseudouridine38-40 synthase
MPRYRLTIEYDGTAYFGWQAQAVLPSVQVAVERALLALTGQTLRLSCAGRTDAGVHARAQVAHCDLAKAWRADTIRDGLNAHLRRAGERVSIIAAEAVPDTFHARISAQRRHYLYRIINRRPPAPLEHHRAWHVVRALDADAMHAAAQHLIGHHDFTTFRDSDCQAKSPVKTLEAFSVMRVGEIIELRTSARSFLHHQVRRMVGSLELVGAGKWSADDLKAALEARDPKRSGMQAPAYGLYFMGVDY